MCSQGDNSESDDADNDDDDDDYDDGYAVGNDVGDTGNMIMTMSMLMPPMTDDHGDDDYDDDDTELQQTGKRIGPPLSSNKLRVSVFETNDVFTNVNDLNDPRIKEKWIQLTKFNVLYNTVKYLKIEHCQQKYPGWNALNMLKTVERSQR